LIPKDEEQGREHYIPFNVDISPSTWIVIFWLRSPFATAVVTIAIDRTYRRGVSVLRIDPSGSWDPPDL
jgi:hypothetical protein